MKPHGLPNSTFSSSYMICILVEAKSYPPSKTIAGQLPYRFFMYVTYASHIYANVSSMVHGTLCKSDPPSRTYLLLGGITCTVSGDNFNKACFNFGLSASFIRSSLSNNDIGLVLNLHPNTVDSSFKLYTTINLWNKKVESTWIFSPSVDSDDFVFMGTTMSLHLTEKLKTNWLLIPKSFLRFQKSGAHWQIHLQLHQ